VRAEPAVGELVEPILTEAFAVPARALGEGELVGGHRRGQRLRENVELAGAREVAFAREREGRTADRVRAAVEGVAGQLAEVVGQGVDAVGNHPPPVDRGEVGLQSVARPAPTAR
jgi:hypothetical protein